MVVTIREQMMAISRSKTVLILKGKAGGGGGHKGNSSSKGQML